MIHAIAPAIFNGELCVIKECVLISRGGISSVFSSGELSLRDFGAKTLSVVIPCGTAIEEVEIRRAFTVLTERHTALRSQAEWCVSDGDWRLVVGSAKAVDLSVPHLGLEQAQWGGAAPPEDLDLENGYGLRVVGLVDPQDGARVVKIFVHHLYCTPMRQRRRSYGMTSSRLSGAKRSRARLSLSTGG